MRPGFDPWVGKIPWKRVWQPTAVFLPGEFQGQRSLAGYDPWGHKELDTTNTFTIDVHVRLFAIPWTVAPQAPMSMEFSRQEYWNPLPCPPPGNLPEPGIEPTSPALQVDSLRPRCGLKGVQNWVGDTDKPMICLVKATDIRVKSNDNCNKKISCGSMDKHD